ncbi:hypothetical protein Anas_14288, partial [Armadillidium nasatum]
MGKFDAPQLISGTIDSSSVGLRWGEGMKKVEEIHYLIQYREGRNSSEWEYYEPETLLSTEQIIIRNLKPYTKYQFQNCHCLYFQINFHFSLMKVLGLVHCLQVHSVSTF